MFEAECPTHGLKQKSGMKGNPPRQSYKPCKQCAAEKAETKPASKAGAGKGSLPTNENPKCKTCHRRLQIKEHRQTADGEDTIYYRCVNKCKDTGQQAPVKSRMWLPESQDNLLPIVEREVKGSSKIAANPS